jgi:hypothetical protein
LIVPKLSRFDLGDGRMRKYQMFGGKARCHALRIRNK